MLLQLGLSGDELDLDAYARTAAVMVDGTAATG